MTQEERRIGILDLLLFVWVTLIYQEKEQQFLERQAWKFSGEPIDVAEMIKFLISDKARFITGYEFIVDGGFTCC